MKRFLVTVAISSLLSAFAGAQGLSGLAGTVSPSSAGVGQPITLTVTAYGMPQGLSPLGGSMIINEVRSGSPNGPCAWCPVGFTQPTTLQVGQTMRSAWDQRDDNGNLVPPGDYFMKVVNWTSGTQWFAVRVEGFAIRNLLLGQGSPTNGQPYVMTLVNGPPGALYITALALTTNNGLALAPSKHLSLDLADPLFQFSISNPNSGLFNGSAGFLDQSGTAAMTLFLPAGAPYINVGLKAQMILLTPGIDVSNTESFTIL